MNHPEDCFPRSKRPSWQNEGLIHVNRRPDQDVTGKFGEEIPVCPQYQLIKICSDLVGTGLAEQEQFCGQIRVYEDSILALSGFRGMRYKPISTCSQVYDALTAQLELIKEGDVGQTLLRWQQVIIERCTDFIVDLTEEDTIGRVRYFLESLKEITGNNEEDFISGRFYKGALHCPQAPKRKEIGIHS